MPILTETSQISISQHDEQMGVVTNVGLIESVTKCHLGQYQFAIIGMHRQWFLYWVTKAKRAQLQRKARALFAPGAEPRS